MYLIGSGSAGKPVQNSPDVSYVIFTIRPKVSWEIVKVSYDVDALCKAMDKSELPDHFADHFKYGLPH